jgi:PhnB protein
LAINSQVEDVDAVFKQAVNAGATIKMQLDDMFWGDRYGILEDPFGHSWSVASHICDVSPEKSNKRSN